MFSRPGLSHDDSFFDEESDLLTYCEMLQKFPSVVLCKTPFKQNMQIKIPDETPWKTLTLCLRPLRYDTFHSSVKVPFTL